MEELLMEVRLLKRVLQNSASSLKDRLDKDEEFGKDTSVLENEVSFGTVLYAITKNLSKQQLKEISDKEMLKHIQKIQVIEED